MAEYQSYERSEEIRPLGGVDVSSGYESLSRTLQQFNNSYMSQMTDVAVQKAAMQGANAGTDLKFKPIEGNTAADVAYNKSAVEANRLAVGADVSTAVATYKQQVTGMNLSPGQSIEKFQALMDGYTTGVLSNIPEANLGYAKNTIKYHALNAINDINKQVEDAQKKQLYVAGLNILQTNSDDALNAAYDGNHAAALSLYSQNKQALQLGLQEGIFSPEMVANHEIQLKKQIHESNYLGGFERALNAGDPQGYMEKFDKASVPSLNPFEKQTIKNKMHAMWSDYKSGHGINEMALGQTIQDEVVKVKNGAQPDASIAAQVQQFAPSKYPKYLEEINNAQHINSVKNMLNATPSYGLQEQVDKIVGIPVTGITSLTSQQQEIVSLKNAVQKERIDDPAGYVMKYNSTVKKAYDNFNTPQPPLTAGDPEQASLNAQAYLGIPPEKQRVVPVQLAAQYVSEIKNTADYGEGLKKLSAIEQRYGNHFPNVLKSLNEQGLPKNYNLLIGLDRIPKSSANIPAAITAFSTPVKELQAMIPAGIAPSIINNEVKAKMDPYLRTTQYDQNTLQYAEGISQFSKYLLASGKAGSASEAAKTAFDTFIGNRYTFEDTYRIPAELPASTVRMALRNRQKTISIDDIQMIRSANPFLSKAYLKDETLRQSIERGHWVSKSDDSGWKWVDVNDLTVKDKNGNPIEVSANDITK